MTTSAPTYTMPPYRKHGEIDYSSLKGYSDVLGLSICWDEGWPHLYDPSAGTHLENWRQMAVERDVLRLENEQLHQRLRRLESDAED